MGDGRAAIVTGAAGGIGRAIAARLAERRLRRAGGRPQAGRRRSRRAAGGRPDHARGQPGRGRGRARALRPPGRRGPQRRLPARRAVAEFPEDRWDALVAHPADEPVPARPLRLGGARRRRATAASSSSPRPTGSSPRPSRPAMWRPSTACSGWSRRWRSRAPSDGSSPPPSAPASCARRSSRARSPTRPRRTGCREERVLEEVILAPHAVKRLIEPDEVADVVAFLLGPGGRAFSGAPVTMDLGWTAR